MKRSLAVLLAFAALGLRPASGQTIADKVKNPLPNSGLQTCSIGGATGLCVNVPLVGLVSVPIAEVQIPHTLSAPLAANGGLSTSNVSNPFVASAAPFEFYLTDHDPDPETTGAILNFRPTLDVAKGHLVGMYIHPHAPLNTTDVNTFVDALDIYQDVPKGVKGSISGIDVNINTHQNPGDAPSFDGDHALGATLTTDTGVQLRGASIVLQHDLVEGVMLGVAVQLQNNVPLTNGVPGAGVGFQAGNSGNESGAAFNANGNWAAGFQYNDFAVPWDGKYTTVRADGFGTREGLAGKPGANQFNVSWDGAKAHLFIDTSDLGAIPTTSTGQTFNGNVTATGFNTGNGTGSTANGTSCTIRKIDHGIIIDASCS